MARADGALALIFEHTWAPDEWLLSIGPTPVENLSPCRLTSGHHGDNIALMLGQAQRSDVLVGFGAYYTTHASMTLGASRHDSRPKH
jgi:hypothetical protein